MKKVGLTFCLGFVLLTCSPTEPCACPAVSPKVEISGAVRTGSGQPLAGVVIQSYARASACPASQPWPDVLQRTTNAAGQYLMIGYAQPPAAQFCLRLVGRRSPGDSVVVETMVADSVMTPNGFRRYRVDLVFP